MGDLSLAQTVFAHLLRVSVCDDAATNEKTDHAMFMKQSFWKLLRFLCELHKEHKIAELQFSAFPLEQKLAWCIPHCLSDLAAPWELSRKL